MDNMNQYHMQQIPYGLPPQNLGPPPSQPLDEGPPLKKQRISRACDRCNQRSTKCIARADGGEGCQTCLNHQKPCTNDRPTKKRGMKPKEALSALRDGESDAKLLLDLVNGGDGVVSGLDEQEKWKRLAVENEVHVLRLVDAYVELIHPVYPLFHVPTLRRRVQGREHLKDWSFFAEVMALCALASVKASDISLEGPWTQHIKDAQYMLSPEVFYAAAESCMPQNLGILSSLCWMRACALLALYGLHVNKIDIMHQYLGTYLSVVTMNSLHDEKNWPQNIGVVEVEMRRRLFWSMYTLDIYISCVFGNVPRHRSDRTNVSDPSEVDDDFISDMGYNPPGFLSPFLTDKTFTDPLCWLYGWNYNVEFYRLLERAINDSSFKRPNARVPLSPKENPSCEQEILGRVVPMYEALDARFKNRSASSPYSEVRRDVLPNRYEIQAASITTTIQLIRMVLFKASSFSTSIENKHVMATNLIATLAQIPTLPHKVISTPYLHHFTGMATLLNEVMQHPISDVRCRNLRNDLALLAEMTSQNAILTANIHAKINLITIHIENPHAQMANPKMEMRSPTPEGEGGGVGVIDPGLNDGDVNHIVSGSGSGVSEGNGGDGKKYDLLTAGGVKYGRQTEGEGNEYVWFLLPGEVGEWGWDGGVVGRGFGAS